MKVAEEQWRGKGAQRHLQNERVANEKGRSTIWKIEIFLLGKNKSYGIRTWEKSVNQMQIYVAYNVRTCVIYYFLYELILTAINCSNLINFCNFFFSIHIYQPKEQSLVVTV